MVACCCAVNRQVDRAERHVYAALSSRGNRIETCAAGKYVNLARLCSAVAGTIGIRCPYDEIDDAAAANIACGDRCAEMIVGGSAINGNALLRRQYIESLGRRRRDRHQV